MLNQLPPDVYKYIKSLELRIQKLERSGRTGGGHGGGVTPTAGDTFLFSADSFLFATDSFLF